MLRPDPLGGVVRVARDVLAPRAGELVVEADADHAAGLADRVKLPVGEVALVRRERRGARMRHDQRALGDRGHVPEAALVQMREVDEDAQLLARAHERAPGVGQAALGGHAVGKRVRPAPRRADRPQPERVQRRQQLEAGVDRLGALDVHDGDDFLAELEVAGRARHAQRSRPLEREQLADAREGVADREVVLDGRLRLAVGRIAVGVRREDREEAAREPAGTGTREV